MNYELKTMLYIVHTMPYTLILYETPKMSINKQPLKIEKKKELFKNKKISNKSSLTNLESYNNRTT